MPNRAGIDIKADGGYVVLPPSIHHRTHRPYQWGTTAHRPGGDAPARLVAACQPRTAPPAPRPPARPPTWQARGISHPSKLLAAHLNAVRHAPEGKRRNTLYGAARGVARLVAAGAIDHDRRRRRTDRRRTPRTAKRPRNPSRHHRRLP